MNKQKSKCFNHTQYDIYITWVYLVKVGYYDMTWFRLSFEFGHLADEIFSNLSVEHNIKKFILLSALVNLICFNFIHIWKWNHYCYKVYNIRMLISMQYVITLHLCLIRQISLNQTKLTDKDEMCIRDRFGFYHSRRILLGLL